jgi:peptidoglycan/LPS O-acetylase OafA/YrhL
MQPSPNPSISARLGHPTIDGQAGGSILEVAGVTIETQQPREETVAGPAAPRGHIPSLDGVRGLAVALVMACHFTWGARPAGRLDRMVLHTAWSGWIGVDLFFVLSGFLITGILLDARSKPHYFRNFYIRRTLRIFPLYYAILVVMLILPLLVWAGARQADWYNVIASHSAWLWTYTSNIPLALSNSWSVGGILGHFWTLAVEEQFYVLWPAVVWLCPNRRFKQLCIGVILVALAVRYGLRSMDKDLAAYVLMPARADAFAIGAWLAAAVRSGANLVRLHRVAWFTLAVSVLGVGRMFLRSHPLFELAPDVQLLGYLLLALGFAAIIALALDTPHGRTIFGSIFRHPALRFLGKYSYAMYCVHPIVQEALKRGPGLTVRTFPKIAGSALPGALLYSLIAFAITTVLALASWHLLERHFLRLKDRFAA